MAVHVYVPLDQQTIWEDVWIVDLEQYLVVGNVSADNLGSITVAGAAVVKTHKFNRETHVRVLTASLSRVVAVFLVLQVPSGMVRMSVHAQVAPY